MDSEDGWVDKTTVTVVLDKLFVWVQVDCGQQGTDLPLSPRLRVTGFEEPSSFFDWDCEECEQTGLAIPASATPLPPPSGDSTRFLPRPAGHFPFIFFLPSLVFRLDT